MFNSVCSLAGLIAFGIMGNLVESLAIGIREV
jgi:hypothetical protein